MTLHVLITGANRGLGFEFARQYRDAGWQVTATCRSPEKASALVELGVKILPLDVSDIDSFTGFATQVRRPLDLFINNAGISGAPRDAQTLGNVDVKSWLDTFLVNTIAPLKLTEALLPLLETSTAAKAVFVSSLMGSLSEDSGGGQYIYRSSKTALNSVVHNLSIDLAPRKITVAALHPGWVKTDMGGSEAPLTPFDSVSGMRRVIEGLSPEKSGAFIGFDGRPIPW